MMIVEASAPVSLDAPILFNSRTHGPFGAALLQFGSDSPQPVEGPEKRRKTVASRPRITFFLLSQAVLGKPIHF